MKKGQVHLENNGIYFFLFNNRKQWVCGQYEESSHTIATFKEGVKSAQEVNRVSEIILRETDESKKV